MKVVELKSLLETLDDNLDVILIDPDTNRLLIPEFFVDTDGLNITSDYSKEHKYNPA